MRSIKQSSTSNTDKPPTVVLDFAKSYRAAVLTRLGRSPRARRLFEYVFWARRRLADGMLRNAAYEFYFTSLFGLDRSFYVGKRMLDVGCGPRGSLEWATMAADRIGVDPLANAYRSLGIGRHQMRYVTAASEALPFPAASFEVVSCINALDHVESVEKSISEIARVTSPGGSIIVVVEIDHEPTPTEPHTLERDVVDLFPGCVVRSQQCFERRPEGMLRSLCEEPRLVQDRGGPAILAVLLERQGPTSPRTGLDPSSG